MRLGLLSGIQISLRQESWGLKRLYKYFVGIVL